MVASLAPERLAGQQLDTLPATVPPAPRRVSLTAGLGNVFGGLRVTIERHLAAERLSVAFGIGGLPETDAGPGTMAAAAAVRAFTSGSRYRAFTELSVALIALSYTDLGFGRFENVERHYGPALSVGYHYTAKGGFTVLVAGGAGWEIGLGRIGPVGLLGLGHTWRR